MDTKVDCVVNNTFYNKYGDRLIFCKTNCGRYTTALDTQLCDYCRENHNEDNSIEIEVAGMLVNVNYRLADNDIIITSVKANNIEDFTLHELKITLHKQIVKRNIDKFLTEPDT